MIGIWIWILLLYVLVKIVNFKETLDIFVYKIYQVYEMICEKNIFKFHIRIDIFETEKKTDNSIKDSSSYLSLSILDQYQYTVVD